jgi:hypothetical protein
MPKTTGFRYFINGVIAGNDRFQPERSEVETLSFAALRMTPGQRSG